MGMPQFLTRRSEAGEAWDLWLEFSLVGLSPLLVGSDDFREVSVPRFREGNGSPLQYSCLEKSHGRRKPVGCGPWGHKESDMSERLHFHFSLSCFGEGNGNPPHCSCLENPRDGREPGGLPSMGSQSRRLKPVSSSHSRVPRLRHSSLSGCLELEN